MRGPTDVRTWTACCLDGMTVCLVWFACVSACLSVSGGPNKVVRSSVPFTWAFGRIALFNYKTMMDDVPQRSGVVVCRLRQTMPLGVGRRVSFAIHKHVRDSMRMRFLLCCAVARRAHYSPYRFTLSAMQFCARKMRQSRRHILRRSWLADWQTMALLSVPESLRKMFVMHTYGVVPRLRTLPYATWVTSACTRYVARSRCT